MEVGSTIGVGGIPLTPGGMPHTSYSDPHKVRRREEAVGHALGAVVLHYYHDHLRTSAAFPTLRDREPLRLRENICECGPGAGRLAAMDLGLQPPPKSGVPSNKLPHFALY